MKNLTKSPAVLLGLSFIFLVGSYSNTFAGIEGSVKPDLYILSIGIDKYPRSELNSLRFAKSDVETVAREFEKRSGADVNSVKKIVLLDEQASRKAILDALEKLSLQMRQSDILIFNFAGYGNEIATVNLNGFYLFPYDADWKNLEETSISTDLLQAYFRRIRAGKKLIIMDSCKSAQGYKSAESAFLESDRRLSRLVSENVLFIGADTDSYEDVEEGHGTITHIVLNGLKGKADYDGNGVVSSRELEAHIYKGGVDYSNQRSRDFHPRTVTQGGDFSLAYTDKKLEEIAAKKAGPAKVAPTANNQPSAADAPLTRADNVTAAPEPLQNARTGEDHALLFANDVFDDTRWNKLKNPQNDVNDIARELKERYHFQTVEIKRNLTTQEIYDTIESYKAKHFTNPKEDQLFIFFAGHGVAERISDRASSGFYVGKDSPYPFSRRSSGDFVQLDRLLTVIDEFRIEHIMVVFDACYSGQVWQPGMQLIQETAAAPANNWGIFRNASFTLPPGAGSFSFDEDDGQILKQPQIPPHVYAKRLMKNRSRKVMTSSDKPVLDSWRRPDGSLSNNSPFADAFLKALRTGGGEDRVLSSWTIVPYIDKLTPEPQTGKLSGSDGAFVFVSAPKERQGR